MTLAGASGSPSVDTVEPTEDTLLCVLYDNSPSFLTTFIVKYDQVEPYYTIVQFFLHLGDSNILVHLVGFLSMQLFISLHFVLMK